MKAAESSTRVGMKEIAREAGVSIATVSMSLADYPHVNEQTKQRVRQVCRQMGYRRLRRRPADGANDASLHVGRKAIRGRFARSA